MYRPLGKLRQCGVTRRTTSISVPGAPRNDGLAGMDYGGGNGFCSRSERALPCSSSEKTRRTRHTEAAARMSSRWDSQEYIEARKHIDAYEDTMALRDTFALAMTDRTSDERYVFLRDRALRRTGSDGEAGRDQPALDRRNHA